MKQLKKRMVIGILAHVDAGKTTLSESILYKTGAIRKLGRVDHQDTFLDTDGMERQRGITIFSKQAMFSLEHYDVTLLDTPGHVDFSTEMERTLQVLDYGILVISGADGVQGHTLTLWKLLKRYHIPVFLFVNKMDQEVRTKEELMRELQEKLDPACILFEEENGDFFEEIATCNEQMLEEYLENNQIEIESIQNAIKHRQVFPCYFGSALKMNGVEELLQGLDRYGSQIVPISDTFSAKVFKIARDIQGNRLTYCKITGGSLAVKSLLSFAKKGSSKEDPEMIQEKVDQIRLYSGEKFETVQKAEVGMICAMTGLESSYVGLGIGEELSLESSMLEPVLTYAMKLPEHSNHFEVLKQISQLEEEDPQLHIVWNEELQEIQIKLMGDVQIDVLKKMIYDRFQLEVEFGVGEIVYKETIQDMVEGVGHFEPLKHYAEVQLVLEPLPRGSGLQFELNCKEEQFGKNWQNLVLSHLEEKEHKGVLTGSAITDVKITLVGGKAHLKHTEGGDFKEATYRTVRQGLHEAKSCLLEPYYEIRMEMPKEYLGRAMTDLQKNCGTFDDPIIENDNAVLVGVAPVYTMREYPMEFTSYTKGNGRIFLSLKGYDICHNEEEIIEKIGYDPEQDRNNTGSSVFCSHGSGFTVPWYEVKQYMHLEPYLKEEKEITEKKQYISERKRTTSDFIGEDEIEAIFQKTFGKSAFERKNYNQNSSVKEQIEFSKKEQNTGKTVYKKQERKEKYLLVDGYNIIFAWEELKQLANKNIDSARSKLADLLCNYQGFTKVNVLLVFDAYRVEGHKEETVIYQNINIIYTKEAQTADQYIEQYVHEKKNKYDITVATSDQLEQVIILGQGANRLSAMDLYEEMTRKEKEIREDYLEKQEIEKRYLFDGLEKEMAEKIENIRLGKNEK